jgi:hypothetical protein
MAAKAEYIETAWYNRPARSARPSPQHRASHLGRQRFGVHGCRACSEAQSRSCRESASWPAQCGSGRIRHYNDVAT